MLMSSVELLMLPLLCIIIARGAMYACGGGDCWGLSGVILERETTLCIWPNARTLNDLLIFLPDLASAVVNFEG